MARQCAVIVAEGARWQARLGESAGRRLTDTGTNVGAESKRHEHRHDTEMNPHTLTLS
jgi:hypothetical protein